MQLEKTSLDKKKLPVIASCDVNVTQRDAAGRRTWEGELVRTCMDVLRSMWAALTTRQTLLVEHRSALTHML